MRELNEHQNYLLQLRDGSITSIEVQRTNHPGPNQLF